MFNGNAILPAGRINPTDPYATAVIEDYGNPEWTDGTVYLLARPGKTQPTLAVVSSGRTVHREGYGESAKWVEDGIGYTENFYHDQTGASKGRYTVVGIVDWDTALLDSPNFIKATEGVVPNKSMRMAVYK